MRPLELQATSARDPEVLGSREVQSYRASFQAITVYLRACPYQGIERERRCPILDVKVRSEDYAAAYNVKSTCTAS